MLTFVASAFLAQADHSVTLDWDPNTESNLAGYRVYYGAGSGQYTNSISGNTNAVTITGLREGVTYFFVVTAFNSDGLESDPSNEVSYTPPCAPCSQAMTLKIANQPTLSVSLGFQTLPACLYELQWTEDLRNWVALRTISAPAAGNTWVTVFDAPPPFSPRRFYRLLVQCPPRP